MKTSEIDCRTLILFIRQSHTKWKTCYVKGKDMYFFVKNRFQPNFHIQRSAFGIRALWLIPSAAGSNPRYASVDAGSRARSALARLVFGIIKQQQLKLNFILIQPPN